MDNRSNKSSLLLCAANGLTLEWQYQLGDLDRLQWVKNEQDEKTLVASAEVVENPALAGVDVLPTFLPQITWTCSPFAPIRGRGGSGRGRGALE